jgi:cobalt-zinc-cadmium efflux system outer membrane protein
MSSERRTRTWLFAFGVAASALISSCSTPPAEVEPRMPPRIDSPLSRAQCVTLALEATPTAATWRARIELADALAKSAAAWPNPSIALEWEDLAAPAGVPIQWTTSLLTRVSDLASRSSRVAEADRDLEAVQLDVEAERIRIAAEALHAYDAVLVARARVELAEESVRLHERALRDATTLADLGEAPRFVARSIDNDLRDANTALDASAREARRAEVVLAFALGLERPIPLRLSDPLRVSEVDEFAASDLESMLRRAVEARPEIAAALARAKARLEQSAVAVNRLDYLPTIAVGRRIAGDATSATASIEVELPIFDRGDSSAAAANAAARLAAIDAESVSRNVTQQVISACEQWTATRHELGSARSAVERGQRNLADHRMLFESGEETLEHLRAARRELLASREVLVNATGAVSSARIDLGAALGELVEKGPQQSTRTSRKS